jgi:hypothetical protein
LENGNYIIPGRECGTCTACCKELAILDDGMRKLPGMLCQHCSVGKGCGIYESRPTVCRTYHCLWRSLPQMSDAWRPDQSGILMIPVDVPPLFAGQFGVNLIMTGSPEVLRSDNFAGMVAGFIESGTAAYLDVPRGVGMLSHGSFLNDQLAPAIAARDLRSVKALVWSCYEAILATPPTPIRPEDMQTT